MNKILKSLTTASVVTVIVHFVVILIQFALNAFELDDILEVIGITIPSLFFPVFFAFSFFDSNKNFKKFLAKIFLVNFLIVFVSVYIILRFVEGNYNHSLFSFVNFIVAIISSFAGIFFTFYQKINSTKTSKFKLDSKKIEFSYVKLFLIPFSGVIFYIIIAAIDTFHLDESIKIIYYFLPTGFILSLISIHFFNYVYNQFSISKRKIYVAFYYFFSISLFVFWIVLSYNNFRIVKNGLGASLDKAFLLPTIVLYTPFFLYVLIVTHFYFTQLINTQEKLFLQQQSLESQLNYQQLKNQLSPHFLFNNINVLTSIIEEDPKKAIQFSNNLASIYYYFLEQEQKDVVKLEDEIQFAKKYLELLKGRFEDALKYKISIDEKMNQHYIVATILQQVLENIIKHNIVNENHIVFIDISSEGNYIVISNNKNSKKQTQSKSGKGIDNIKKRVAFFTEENVIVENLEKNYIIKLPLLETI